MIRCRAAGVLAVSVIAGWAGIGGVGHGSSAQWGNFRLVPGMESLLQYSGSGNILAMSCPAPGACTAGGWHSVGQSDVTDAFVVTESRGRWGRAKELRGVGFGTIVYSVSCASPGNCVAGGDADDFGSGGTDRKSVV